jgi:bacillithiol system protein YtxJ
MGLLHKILGSKSTSEVKEETIVPWHRLQSIDQLDVIVEESKSKPVAIFKHSTRCGISRMVMRQFESSYSVTDEQLKLYYLDLLSFRNVSDEVGYKFQVMHQSPQLIVIKNGSAIHHASHSGINASYLENLV